MKNFIKTLLLLALSLVFISPVDAERVFFYHNDTLGTPLAMTDSTGAKVWEAVYQPFGEEYSVSQTVENNKRFIGKEKDAETGFNYFGARYMSAGVGRFLSPNPVRVVDAATGKINEIILSDTQRQNLYVYSLNNPYRFVDPDGQWVVGAIIGAFAGGIGGFQSAIISGGSWKAAVLGGMAGGMTGALVGGALPDFLGISASSAAGAAVGSMAGGAFGGAVGGLVSSATDGNVSGRAVLVGAASGLFSGAVAAPGIALASVASGKSELAMGIAGANGTILGDVIFNVGAKIVSQSNSDQNKPVNKTPEKKQK